MKVAIPTLGKGGLDCERSGHFGHCGCFTVVDVQDGKVGDVSVIENPPHEEGGCTFLRTRPRAWETSRRWLPRAPCP